MANPEETMSRLLESNMATAMVFNRASTFKRLDTGVPYEPKSLVWEAAEIMNREASNLAKEYLPWLLINVRHGVLVCDIDVSDPTRPSLAVLDVKTGEKRSGLVYDLVIKCTGATFEVSVSGEVKNNAFTGAPKADDLTRYLEQRKMLDNKGNMISRKKFC
ncbi:hypothetical protein TWF730_007724 [Orbilia blumenaviensis]|uniref:Uncharacterized protein n=1 Tax=Orbilia blumenaviensis TaxID=1796055 RepID=A0AAV9VCF4_9PEZI